MLNIQKETGTSRIMKKAVITLSLCVPLFFSLRAEELSRDAQAQQDLLLMKQDKVFGGQRTAGIKLEIEEVSLPAPIPKTKGGFPIPVAKVRNGHFLKDGKPAYLVGGEASLNQYPFLYQVMGFDWLELGGGGYLANTLRAKREGDTVKVSFRTPKELELQVREALEHGFLPYVEFLEESREVFNGDYPALNNDAKDLFVTLGHFYLFRHDNPDAWKIRENAIKKFLASVGNYPVFAYELFNEVNFTDYGPATLDGFRMRMAQSYGDMGKANKAWGTTFKRFQDVTPPLKGGGGDASFTVLSRNVSRMLWLDWLKFSESNSAAAFRKSAELFRRYDPGAYLTTQAHCQFFYDYGAHGVNPLLKSGSEDFYGDESGGAYYQQMEDYENPRKINEMLVRLLWLDYLCNLIPDKPQVSEETSIGGGFMDTEEFPHVIDMRNDNWKFMSDNDASGIADGYQHPGYNDAEWKNIKVPDMWANQGYAETRFAWYRYHFSVPRKYEKRQLYLNGRELADVAKIYLNGKEIYTTKIYNEQFGLDITTYLNQGDNVLSISVKNDYFQSGRYWGGIRGGMTIDMIDGGRMIPLNYAQARSFFWERALHGEAGVFPSYAYSPEGDLASLFSPEKIAYSALRGIPQAKVEIDSVGSLVLAEKPRWSGKIALVYPLETMRHHVHKDVVEMVKGPLTHDLAKWYAGLLFSGVPMSVVSNECLIDGDLNRFQAVFMRGNDRVPLRMKDAVRKYVADGGALILDASSCSRDDDSDGLLAMDDLLGCARATADSAKGVVDLSGFSLEKAPFAARERDGSSGCVLALKGAKAIAYDDVGAPAIAVARIGNGNVYVLARELSENATSQLLQAILRREEIHPPIRLEGMKALPYVETHLLGERGRYLLYLHNWGGGEHEVRIRITDNLAAGSYLVRELESGKALAEKITAAELKGKGLAVKLASQAPLALLLEDCDVQPIPLKRISAEQRGWLDYIARKSPKNVPAHMRVLMDAAHYNQFSRIHLLTAAKLLEDSGYEVNVALGPIADNLVKTYTDHVGLEYLGDYGIMFFGGMRTIQPKEAQKLTEWVKNGGSVFICGNRCHGPHGWLDNYGLDQAFYSQFGASVENLSFMDATNNVNNEPCYPVFTNIGKNDITNGIKQLHTQGMGVLRLSDPAWVSLVEGGGTSNYPNKPAVAVRLFGKGKVVLCGDAAWLKPTLLAQGDNRALFLNLMRWLSVGK